jgi:uncharacterized membrane protein
MVFVVVIATFVAALLIYPYMPEKIASHWGINNEVNGYMGRFWGTFLVPMMMLGFSVLFMVISRIDPKKQNIEKFQIYFDLFIIMFLFFFVYIYSLTIFWNLGYVFNLVKFMSPAFAMLFYVMGVMIKHSESNWSIGIRTPWTLSSENVWRKTHELGGKLFKAVAFISLLGVLMPEYAVYFVLIPVISVAVFSFVYSYLIYKKEIKNYE